MKATARQMTLAELLKAHEAFIDQLRKRGARIRSFNTPCCSGAMETMVPKDGQTWDTLTTCPHCGQLFMKICRRDKAFGVMPPDIGVKIGEEAV